MVGPRSRWDEQRAQKRRDSSAGMPTCSKCKKPSVLDPCRACAALATAEPIMPLMSPSERER